MSKFIKLTDERGQVYSINTDAINYVSEGQGSAGIPRISIDFGAGNTLTVNGYSLEDFYRVAEIE